MGLVAMLVLGPACRAWVAMGVADLIMGVCPASCPGVQMGLTSRKLGRALHCWVEALVPRPSLLIKPAMGVAGALTEIH